MGTDITLPLWLAAILALLALWAALERLLIPSVRWVLRRRLNRVIDELNTRLPLEIQPFKLTKRQVLIDRLIYDGEILEAVAETAEREEVPRQVVMADVERFAREIVPAFNAYFYFRIGYWLSRRIAQMLYRVRLGFADEAALATIDRKTTVVFVMNHRSNADYVLVTYLAADQAALSYAVGEWARIWGLRHLIRAMGAYFVRRGSDNRLYRRVLQRYVQMATEGGVTQAVFLEGGLSRDGSLGAAKLGLLDYIARAFEPEGERELVFLPVGINYDRVLEDRSLLRSLDQAARRKSRTQATRTTLAFLGHQLALAIRGRWFRFGYATVNFGRPLSLRAWLGAREADLRDLSREQRFANIQELADELMAAIALLVPVLPVSVVATAFFADPQRSLSLYELKAECHRLQRMFTAAGAHVYLPRGQEDYAITVGLRMLTLRHLVAEEDGLYHAVESELPVLSYYAKAVAHLLPKDGVAATTPA